MLATSFSIASSPDLVTASDSEPNSSLSILRAEADEPYNIQAKMTFRTKAELHTTYRTKAELHTTFRTKAEPT